MKRQILVCYDTPNTKRRNKISAHLEKYGARVNYSVFEIIINDTKLKKLEAELSKILKPKEDSVRIYHICENCLHKSKTLTNDREPFLPVETLII
ncbi:MAG: CRISPR-associated endonuclease Cas2 [Campylobacterales bacterium]|nr:CRISPR-associated endonuclease Cas2 [Campylobacterales bacterium]